MIDSASTMIGIGFSLLDFMALVCFLLCWCGYVLLADKTPLYERSVSAYVNHYRTRWMRNMVQRELRMVDTLIHTNLVQGVAFFASTSILLVGGLIAILGATDKAIAVLAELPFVPYVSHTAWELKVLMLVVIFIYAFFKFAWCFRLFNYCSIMIGAASLDLSPNDDNKAFAHRIAELHALAGRHFNSGLRAYFFALATLGWFLHPLLFILSTLWVTYILYRREFHSRSFQILSRTD